MLRFLIFMPYFVYIIFSDTYAHFYKGSTDDPVRRLKEHNQNRNQSTKGKGPWKMVFLRAFDSKPDALKEEKRLKRTNTPYLNWMITQTFNEIEQWQEALSRLD